MPPDSVTSDAFEDVLVTPRYLAGGGYSGDPGFAPVAHWPHHELRDGPCQLLVTSPDQRIRIGWFGDDFETFKISAAEDAVSPPCWRASFHHQMPPEIVAGLTTALARDWAEADDGDGRFLHRPSMYLGKSIQPLTDAGWTRRASKANTIEFVAPDGQAGVFVNNRLNRDDDEAIVLWAGPPGYGRAKAYFSAATPSHLIAATAAALADPAPLTRERHMIDRSVAHLVTLTPLTPLTPPQPPRAPTPLDVRRTAVVQAVRRAEHTPHPAASLRVQAARSRTTAPPPRPQHPAPLASASVPPAPAPTRHSR